MKYDFGRLVLSLTIGGFIGTIMGGVVVCGDIRSIPLSAIYILIVFYSPFVFLGLMLKKIKI
jgi:hypothetical protein